MPLSSCVNVLILVSLAQKFTNNEDITFKKLSPLWHVLLVPLITGYHNVTSSPINFRFFKILFVLMWS